MITPARSLPQFLCRKSDTRTGIAAGCNVVAKWRKSAMSIHKICARSGREADAVRGRSAHALPDAIVPSVLASRTPARCQAKIVSANLGGAFGSGVAVPQGTGRNRLGNAQTLDVVEQSARFPRFPRFGQTQMRACAGAHTHAYTRGGKQGTREPLNFILYVYMVSGSLTGSLVVPLGTGFAGSGTLRLARGESDILTGGNGAQLLDMVVDRSIRGRNLGRGGESFRVFGRGLAPIGLELGRIQQLGENGGNPPFSGCSIRRVGRAILEGGAQSADLASVSWAGILPSRSARRAPASRLAIAQAVPLCPHFGRSDPLACWRSTVSEFGSASPSRRPARREAFSADSHGAAGCAKVEAGQMGRGEGSAVQAPRGLTGRGERRCCGGLALRRDGHASGEVGRVN